MRTNQRGYIKKNVFIVILAMTMTVVSQVRSDDGHDTATDWTSSRPDGHAPIGIMGDHTHHAGEWMLSYRHMIMEMEGNREGYALGDRAETTLWGARKWNDWFSSSLRLDGQFWGNIDGKDDDLNPEMVPTADAKRRSGRKVDLLVGFNLYGRSGLVRGHRLSNEFGVPLYQTLDGPQLETDYLLTAGWQYAW